jgi:hypothetical protein
MYRIAAQLNRLAAHTKPAILAIWLVLSGALPASAVDIVGTLNAALDQPRVNVVLQRPGEAVPIGGLPNQGSYISAYLDTGSSGILISAFTADQLGLNRLDGVIFSDVGVNGPDNFNVSEQINVKIATNTFSDPENVASYNHSIGPLHTQVGPVPPPLDPLLESLDIIGMPGMMGKVTVMDPKPLNELVESGFFEGGFLSTYLYDPNTPFNPANADEDPGIPTTSHHVQLSYGDFERFTTIDPPGSPRPQLNHNPFIGPDPVAQLDADADVVGPPGISIGYGGLQTGGSFLLDTGAAASFISEGLAADLNIRYVEGTYGSDNPVLEFLDPAHPELGWQELGNQFDLIVGGIGGVGTISGFFLDEMVLHTLEGGPALDDPNNIRFLGAPVLVADIGVVDPVTQQQLILDGVFGMNFMVASLQLDGFELGDLALGPFDWITFDEPNGILGLQVHGAVPEPGALVLAALAIIILAGYRFQAVGRRL